MAQPQLYVTLNNSKGYVVGAKLQQSGIFRYAGDTTWTHIGWNHPFISGLAFVDDAAGTIQASAGNGQMRSLDGGQTWRITTGWEVTETQHIAIDHADRSRIYLATAYGIWVTPDGADSWQQATSDYAQAVAADVSSDGRAIAATEHGLMLTSDGGASWRLVGTETPMVDVAQSVSEPMQWIAGSRSDGILRSTDGGETWSQSLDTDSSASGVAIDPFNDLIMSAVTWGGGAFVSADGGATWLKKTAGLPTPYLVETSFDAGGSGRLWVATREEGVFLSDDLGESWTYAGMTGTMVFDMVFAE